MHQPKELSMLRRTFVATALAAAVVLAGPALAQESRLNPNNATPEQLAGIAGLNADLREQIVATRPFPTIIEFDALVRKTLAAEDATKVYEQLFIPINLNSSSPDEIALIPGMSRRMVREFLEYRPYADLSVFDREIGKYVDDAEVARLRSYVTL
jgi:hypothetical protein